MKEVKLFLPEKYVDEQVENKYNAITKKLDVIVKKVKYTPRPFIFNIPIVAGNPPKFTPYFKDIFKASFKYNSEDSLDEQITKWYKEFLAIDPRNAAIETKSLLEELDLVRRINPGQTIKLDVRIVQELKKHSSWAKELEIIGDLPSDNGYEEEVVQVTSFDPDAIQREVATDTSTKQVSDNSEEDDFDDNGDLKVSAGGAAVNKGGRPSRNKDN